MIELIPAIDIIDGKCVRLTQGDYSSKKVYNEDPVEVAKSFEAHGITRLHVVDLDGARAEDCHPYGFTDRFRRGTQTGTRSRNCFRKWSYYGYRRKHCG